jgi:hypothetical protein
VNTTTRERRDNLIKFNSDAASTMRPISVVALIGAQIAAALGQQATTVLNALLNLSFTGCVLRFTGRGPAERSRPSVKGIRFAGGSSRSARTADGASGGDAVRPYDNQAAKSEGL